MRGHSVEPDPRRRLWWGALAVLGAVVLVVVGLAIAANRSADTGAATSVADGPIAGWAAAPAEQVAVVDAALTAWADGDAAAFGALFATRSSYLRMGRGETGIAEGPDAIAARFAELVAAGERPVRVGDVVAEGQLVAFGTGEGHFAVVDVDTNGHITRYVDVVPEGPTLALPEPASPLPLGDAVLLQDGLEPPIVGWAPANPGTLTVLDQGLAAYHQGDWGAFAAAMVEDISFVEVGTGGTGQIQGRVDVVRTNRLLAKMGATYSRVSGAVQQGAVVSSRTGCPDCPGVSGLIDLTELDDSGRTVRLVMLVSIR